MTVEGVRVGVDVGGTFTDLVACDAAGRTSALKVPTTPANPAGGLLNGLTAIGRVAGRCASLAHGTTLVTNAIVERKIGVVGLVTTRGFRDVLEIGRMNRPHLYRIDLPAKPEPLVPRRLRAEVSERVGPDGSVLASLDLGEVAAIVERFRRQGWWLRRSFQSRSRPRDSFRQPSRGRRFEGTCHHRGFVACALHRNLR